jgi:hypothetical protein
MCAKANGSTADAVARTSRQDGARQRRKLKLIRTQLLSALEKVTGKRKR